jgi:hypothetical protein
MTGVDLEAIHRALAGQVQANIADDWNVAPFPYSAMERPLIEVWPGEPYVEPQPEGATFCQAGVNLRVRIFMSAGEGETAFIRMSRALSSGLGRTSSVRDAVDRIDPTLGGVVLEALPGETDWSPTDQDLGTVAEIAVAVLVDRGA